MTAHEFARKLLAVPDYPVGEDLDPHSADVVMTTLGLQGEMINSLTAERERIRRDLVALLALFAEHPERQARVLARFRAWVRDLVANPLADQVGEISQEDLDRAW